MRLLIYVLVLSNVIFAYDFSSLENPKHKINIEAYKKLNKIDNSKIKDLYQFQYMKQPKEVMSNFKGYDFVSKQDLSDITKRVNETKKFLNKRREFIFYLTSTTVPKEAILNIALQTGILRHNGVDIMFKSFFQGFPNDFKDYLFSIRDSLKEKPFEIKKYIGDNLNIKVNPYFFDKFKIKKAPVILLAECRGINPILKNCKVKYLLHGDVSLYTFFDKISLKEDKYKKYTKYLLTNNFGAKKWKE